VILPAVFLQSANFIDALYIVAFSLFIYGMSGLTGPRTAVRGNLIAATGMAIAVVATLLTPHVLSGSSTPWLIALGLVLGTAGGIPAARRVKMTAMPQMVALFNGVGGGAVFLIAWAEFRNTGGYQGKPTYFAVFSLFAMNRLTLMPLFADQVLHVGARGFGFLLGSMGLGALTGALTLAFFPRLGADPRRQLWMAAIWVAALIEFSISRVFAISLVTLFVAGYCQISFVASANLRIQTLTPDHLRGRVMALYAQALIGVGPFGAMQAGALATLLGAPRAMAIGAAIAGAVVLAIRLFRPAVFGHPSQTSSSAATASAGTSQRSART